MLEGNPIARSESIVFAASERYRWYAAWLLAVVYLFNQVDRQIFAILQEPIKRAFQFSDSELGLIGGMAFGLFYATLAVPIGRLADRGNRVSIISVSLGLWSAFTALTGLARNFWQMLGARLLVGVGEAGCNPCAHSLLSDYFEPQRRATAIAVYSLGVSAGSIVGLLVGSKIAELHGWQMAFYVMGLPGLLLAIFVKLTLREPPRGFSDPNNPPRVMPSVRAVLDKLRRKRSFVFLVFGAATYSIAANGIGQFYSSFLIRSHHLSLSETGRWLALATTGGLIGTLLCGRVTDFLTNKYRDARWLLWTPACVLLLNLPIGLLLYTTDDLTTTLVLLIVSVSLGTAYLSPTIATTQRLAAANERALASALLFVVMSFIGLIIGPWLTGKLSVHFKDALLAQGVGASQADADGLRSAFVCMLAAPILAIALYWLAARHVRGDLDDSISIEN